MFTLAVISLKVGLLLVASGFLCSLMLAEQDRHWAQRTLVPIFPAAFVAAALLPNILAISIFIFLMPALLARTKGDAAALFPVLLISLPALSFPVRIGSVGIGNYDTWLIASIGTLIAVIIKPGATRKPLPLLFPVGLFIILTIFAGSRGDIATVYLRTACGALLSFLLPFLIVQRGISQPEHARRFLLSIVFGAVVLSVLAVYEARSSWPTYETLYQHLGIDFGRSQTMKIRGGLMRAAASFPESGAFSIFCAAAATIALILRDNFRSRSYRAVVIGVIIAGIFVAQTRAAWLTLALAIVLVDCFNRRWGHASGKLLTIACLAVLTQFIGRLSPRFAGITGISNDAVSTVDYRKELYRRGMEEIAKHPFVGNNMKSVMSQMADMRQGEGIIDFVNGYIYFGLLAGWFGIAIIVFVLTFPSWRLFSARNRLKRDKNYMQVGSFFFAFTTSMIVICFTSGFGIGLPAIQYFMYMGCASAALALAHDPLKRSFATSGL